MRGRYQDLRSTPVPNRQYRTDDPPPGETWPAGQHQHVVTPGRAAWRCHRSAISDAEGRYARDSQAGSWRLSADDVANGIGSRWGTIGVAGDRYSMAPLTKPSPI